MLKSIQLEGLSSPVSSLIMGSDYFTPENQDTATEMIENYLRIGGNTIDTAFIYSGGLSEQAIGHWLDAGNRDRVNIWTKGGHPNQHGHTINKAELQEQLKISLDRLRTDHVELYALHRDDPSVPVGQILEWLNQFVEDGYISTFGGSNWETSRLEEANEYAAKHGLRGFAFSSPNLSLAKAKEAYWPGCISLDPASIQWHQQSNIPVLSWSSQARGFFTGRFDRNDFTNEDLVRVFYNDENWQRFDRATELANEKGVSTIEIALAYVLNQSFPTAAIIGPQNNEEMLSCAHGAKLNLTAEEVNWLNLDIATHSR